MSRSIDSTSRIPASKPSAKVLTDILGYDDERIAELIVAPGALE